jgi:hypothetical protein
MPTTSFKGIRGAYYRPCEQEEHLQGLVLVL